MIKDFTDTTNNIPTQTLLREKSGLLLSARCSHFGLISDIMYLTDMTAIITHITGLFHFMSHGKSHVSNITITGSVKYPIFYAFMPIFLALTAPVIL